MEQEIPASNSKPPYSVIPIDTTTLKYNSSIVNSNINDNTATLGIKNPTPLYNFVSTLSDSTNTESSVIRIEPMQVLATTTENIKLQTFQSVQSEPTTTKVPSVLTTITTVKPTKSPVTKSPVTKSTKRPSPTNSASVTNQSVRPTTKKPTKPKPTNVTKGPIMSNNKTTNTLVRTTKRPTTQTKPIATANKPVLYNSTTIPTTVKPIKYNEKLTTFSTVTSESTTAISTNEKNSTNGPTAATTTTTASHSTTTATPLITISFVETTRVPKPKPKPTSQIVSMSPTNLDYLTSDQDQTTASIITSTDQQMFVVASNESSTISIEPNLQTQMPLTTMNAVEIKESVSTLMKDDESTFQSSLPPPMNNNATEMPGLVTWSNFIENQTEELNGMYHNLRKYYVIFICLRLLQIQQQR